MGQVNSETKYYYKFRDMRKLFLLAIVLCVWSVVADAQESEGRYIEVTGSSEIEVVPDKGILERGICAEVQAGRL
jgi:uncharacterized protein YggE